MVLSNIMDEVIELAISLQKGQSVDLTKGNPGLSKIMVGLGWDPVEAAVKKVAKAFSVLFLAAGMQAQISTVMLLFFFYQKTIKLTNQKDVIYFGNLKSKDGSVEHSGDNLTGDGDGDDEQIFIELIENSCKYSQNCICSQYL